MASLFTSFDARALALSAFSLELFKYAELRDSNNVSAFNSLKVNEKNITGKILNKHFIFMI